MGVVVVLLDDVGVVVFEGDLFPIEVVVGVVDDDVPATATVDAMFLFLLLLIGCCFCTLPL